MGFSWLRDGNIASFAGVGFAGGARVSRLEHFLQKGIDRLRLRRFLL
jgi:hypothetical protein